MRKRKSPIDSFVSAVKDYFTFTIGERKAAITLISIQIILLLGIFFINFNNDATLQNTNKLEIAVKQLDDLYRQDSIAQIKIADTIVKTDSVFSDSTKFILPEKKLFVFNPNNLADSLWMQLGLSPKQIRVIKNYENKGGKFYKKEDVKKMYCISEKEYNRMEPFIVIPEMKKVFATDSTKKFAEKTNEIKTEEIPMVDLNSSLEEEFDKLPAIGMGRAISIVKMRDLLGGYTNIEQLKEAYGITDSVYDAIKNYVEVRTKNIRKININTSNPFLLRHPYISTSLAKIIVRYREQHGDYTAVSDIKKLGIVPDELYKKLSPYLTIQ